MREARLTINGLRAGYRDRPVFADLTLPPIDGGAITALVGPNGAGKSTLLRAAAGLVRATGSIRLGEIELVGARPRARAGVAFMPQSLPVQVGLTVLEGVISAIRASPLDEGAEQGRAVERRALDALERIGIVDIALRPLDALSGGQRQLASLAQVAARDPRLLLLDEPTSALDLRHQVDVMDLVSRMAGEGRIVIVVVHDLSLAARWAREVVVMADGRVDSVGPPATTLTTEMLARVYGVEARIEPCTRGRRQIIIDGPVGR